MSVRVGNKGIAAVEWRVEPFVAVTGPGIGQPDPLQPVPVFEAGRSPQAECAVDMGPCTVRASNQNKLRKRVVGADVEIAGLK